MVDVGSSDFLVMFLMLESLRNSMFFAHKHRMFRCFFGGEIFLRPPFGAFPFPSALRLPDMDCIHFLPETNSEFTPEN